MVKKDSELTEDDVKNFIAGQLSKHKHLAGGFQFVENIPVYIYIMDIYYLYPIIFRNCEFFVST